MCDVNLWGFFVFSLSLSLQTTNKAVASAGRRLSCFVKREGSSSKEQSFSARHFYPNPVHLVKENMYVSCDGGDSVLELQDVAQADVTNAARVILSLP